MRADIEIVDEVMAGHRGLYAELIERHQRGLLRMCLRMTHDLGLAEDIVQDSFIKAFQKLSSFERKSSFKSWLYQIAINTAKNLMRSRKHETVNIDNVQIAVSGDLGVGLEHEDLQGLIREEVDRLPEKQKMVLILRIFEDLSFKEIALIMKCPYDTAKANYRHALLKLRHRIEGNEEFRIFRDSGMGIFNDTNSSLLAEVEQ